MSHPETDEGDGWEQTVENLGNHPIMVVDEHGDEHNVAPGAKYRGQVRKIVHGDKPSHYTVN